MQVRTRLAAAESEPAQLRSQALINLWTCRRGGCFFSKRSRGMMQVDRPHLLAVEDPNEPTNDLGKGSYNIQKVGAQVLLCLQ